MTWLFFLLAAGTALFTLPGGGRSSVDRRLLQSASALALAAAFATLGLYPLALLVVFVGGGMYAIGWLRDKLMGGETFQDLHDGPRARSSWGGADQRGTGKDPSDKGMSEAEALAVLGLAPGVSPEEVTAAHKRMIAKAHPDQGGSDYLAAKVNAARDRLLG